MKRLIVLMLAAFLVPSRGVCLSIDWTKVKHTLTIQVAAPPALMYVQDSSGRRTGADPNKPMTAEGAGTPMIGIPASDLEDINLASDEAEPSDRPPEHTSWMVTIMDGGKQTYTVHLIGTASDIAVLSVGASMNTAAPLGVADKSIGHEQVVVLMGAGIHRTLSVDFDPGAERLVVSRQVRAMDLDGSLRTLCGLGLIKPAGICKSLRKKAAALARAMSSKQWRSARNILEALMSELRAQDGKHVRAEMADLFLLDANVLLNELNAKVDGGRSRRIESVPGQ